MLGNLRPTFARGHTRIVAVLDSFTLPIATPMRARWSALPRANQRLLVVLGVIVAGVLGWAFLWRPIQQQRATLLQKLPIMQQQLATMRAQALEVNNLQAMPSTASVGTGARRITDVSAVARTMGDSVRVQRDASARFVLSTERLSYAQFLDRLDTLLATNELRLVSLNVVRSPTAGTAAAASAASAVSGSTGLISIDAVLVDRNRAEIAK